VLVVVVGVFVAYRSRAIECFPFKGKFEAREIFLFFI